MARSSWRGVVGVVFGGLALVPGCLEIGSAWDPTTAGQTATSSATTSTTGTSTGTGASTSTSASASTSAGASTSTGDSSTTGCSFLGCPEDQPIDDFQCDINVQDCPEGEKCNLWSTEGGEVWNAMRCVPVVDDSDKVGEACTALQSGFSGIDTCELGAICWGVDGNNEGTCVAYCIGDWGSGLVCPEGHSCRGSRWITLCMPGCDPILQDCPGDDLCLPSNEGFQCVLDASGDAGAFGDPCEYANACDPGLVCLNPGYVPKCEASGCCSPFCDTGAPNTCPAADMQCLPWFEEGMAPQGFETVGVCGLPQ